MVQKSLHQLICKISPHYLQEFSGGGARIFFRQQFAVIFLKRCVRQGTVSFVILPHVASMKQKGSQGVEGDQTLPLSWLVNQTPKTYPPRLTIGLP